MQYQAVQTIRDLLTADVRDFRFGVAANQVIVADAAQPGDGLSNVSWNQHPAVPATPAFTVTFDSPLDDAGHRCHGRDRGRSTHLLEVVGLDAAFDADLNIYGSVHDRIIWSGPVDLDGGDLTVIGGDVEINESITTEAAVVEIRAFDEVTIAESGRLQNPGGVVDIEAASIAHSGSILAADGHVTLDSGDAGVTVVRGLINVAATDVGATGGTVHVLGMYVGLFDQARIDASGAAGGGVVLIGGDYQGKNPHIRNAQRTYVGPETTIHTDATTTGDGGTVIVWADDWTKFYGNISAQGGADSGDGGFVETSGKVSLVVIGASVDSSASHGRTGTWLLDPSNVEITAATANIDQSGVAPVIFSPNADSATIDVATINASLNLGTSVTVNTVNAGGTQDGDITVTSAVSKTAGGDATLTLLADDDIFVNNTINSTSNALNVVLTANADSSGGGNVDINNNITTNGGTFDSSGVGFDNSGGTITTAGGAVTINHDGSGAIVIGAQISAGAGDVTIDATGTGDISLTDDTANPAIDLTTGALSLTAAGGALNASQDNDNADISTSGDVTLSGIGIGNTSPIDIGLDNDGGTLTVESNGTSAVDIDATTANGFSNIVIVQALADSDIDVQNANVNDVIDIDGAAGVATIVNVDMSTEGATFTYTLNEDGSDLVVNSATITAGDDVSLSSEDDITVGSGGGTAIDGSGGAFNVILTADNDSDGIGRIIDGGGSIDMSGGGDLILLAGSGIGTNANFLKTQASNLDIRNTAAGGVFVENTGELTLTDLDAAPAVMAGGGVIRASSPLNINVDPFPTGATDFVASNDNATAGDTITINANITHDGNGLLRFLAGDDIVHASGNIQSTGGGANEVHMLANQEGAGSGDGDDGGIQQSGGAIATNNLLLTAHEDIQYTQSGNNVAFLAGSVTGSSFTFGYRDSNGVTVGTVNAISGVTTNNGDVKLTVDCQRPGHRRRHHLGTGNLFLDVTGNVTQQAGDYDQRAGLALDGRRHDDADRSGQRRDQLRGRTTAASPLYRDADTLNIESITVDGMTVTGITTTNDDVKLTVEPTIWTSTTTSTSGPATCSWTWRATSRSRRATRSAAGGWP